MKKIIKFIWSRIIFITSSIAWSANVSINCHLKKKSKIQKNTILFNSAFNDNLIIKNDAIVSGVKGGRYNLIHSNTTVVNSILGNYVQIFENSRIYNSKINDCSYLASGVLMFNTTIGKYCSVGPRVIFGHGDHPVDRMSTSPSFYSIQSPNGKTFVESNIFDEFKPILIGNDVWIGANVYIKHGINIGDGAIIASGAVITKDVEPYSIVGGIPAQKIKMRFNKKKIKEISNLKWWDWDEKKILQNAELFQIRMNNLL